MPWDANEDTASRPFFLVLRRRQRHVGYRLGLSLDPAGYERTEVVRASLLRRLLEQLLYQFK